LETSEIIAAASGEQADADLAPKPSPAAREPTSIL
jgi:hypothetical protein